MESQIMMIGAAIFVGSAILIYIISIFGIREKTYDEVIEEQRRERMESMKTKVRVEKRDKYKKKYKKPGKEKDDREDSVEKREDTPVFEESVQAAKMVELEIEPEIIEPVGTPKLKAKKAKKQKPILVNKEEKSYTQVDQEVPETFHPKHLPKDEIEMKHAHEEEVKKDVAPRVNKTKKRHEPVAEKIEKTRHVDVESEIIVSQVAPQMAAPPMPAPEKVKKIKKRQEEPVENGSGDVFPSQDFAATLRHANMTDAEIQGLIDILLNKQAGKMEWNKKAGKSDPITVLKKQLEDKEKSLQEEQQLAMSHQSRIKEMQKELQQEKGRYLVLNKTSQEKVEAKEQECLALQRRMQQAHEQHVQEMSKAKMQMGDGQAAMMVQRLQEENKQLKDAAGKAQMNSMPGPDTSGLQQQLKIVQGELNNNVIKLSALDNAKRALEQKVNRYEEQLRKSEGSKKETEAVCTRKLQEVQEELRKLQNRNSNSDKEYERVSHGKETAETECAFLKNRLQQFESSHGAAVGDLESKLKEAHGSKSELDNKIRHLESLIAEKDKLVKAKESEMKEVVEENRELRSCRQRQAGEGEESPKKPAGAPNGDVHPEEKIESKIAITEHEKILNQLQSDMQTKDSTIATLQNDLESQKKKNNDLREKNWKAMEALNKAEDGVKQRIADALHSNKSGEKDKQILDLLHLLKENSTTIVQEEINKVRQKLSKIFPDISVDIDDEENSDWWDEFEEKAKDHITSVARRQSMHVEVKLNESLEVQTKLQTQVEHYKTVLGDTESMLNKLQSSVETEEKKWQEKLSVTEKELHAKRMNWIDEAKNEMESLQESVTLQMKGSTEDLHDLGFAYRCVEKSLTTIVDEMEVKVESLEAQLDESEKEKEVLSTELKESEEKNRLLDEELSSVQREKETLQSELKESQDILSSVKSELEKLKVSLAAQEQIKKQALLQESRLLELDSVKAQLASEKSSKEELAQSNAKINSLLKTGQEALQQEQAMVKKLQAQLEEAKKTNADAESKEIAELKSKLDEREKQLEREIASNQALSQKLPIKPPMPKTRKRSVFKGIHVGHFSCFMDGWFQASLHIRQRSACNNLYIIYFSR
ncbi:ribosome-binding protein 1-like isoform X15 [Lineus longissimus]|uniref:ribosome-binding protein 1-like isoform X15 n=1 Tax=Lineus longissimus TaxID=88925 RepID=UPI00315D8A06